MREVSGVMAGDGGVYPIARSRERGRFVLDVGLEDTE